MSRVDRLDGPKPRRMRREEVPHLGLGGPSRACAGALAKVQPSGPMWSLERPELASGKLGPDAVAH
jgi:hypothetical protein